MNGTGHLYYTGEYFKDLDWNKSYLESKPLVFGSLPDSPLIEPSPRAVFNCSKNHNEGVFCYYMPSDYFIIMFKVRARNPSELVTEWSRVVRIPADTSDHKISINHKFLLVDAVMINTRRLHLTLVSKDRYVFLYRIGAKTDRVWHAFNKKEFYQDPMEGMNMISFEQVSAKSKNLTDEFLILSSDEGTKGGYLLEIREEATLVLEPNCSEELENSVFQFNYENTLDLYYPEQPPRSITTTLFIVLITLGCILVISVVMVGLYVARRRRIADDESSFLEDQSVSDAPSKYFIPIENSRHKKRSGY